MRCLLTSWSVNQSKLEKREFTKKYSFALLQQQQEYDSKLLCLLWITLNRFEKVTQPKVQSWYYRVSAWWARRCTLEGGMGGAPEGWPDGRTANDVVRTKIHRLQHCFPSFPLRSHPHPPPPPPPCPQSHWCWYLDCWGGNCANLRLD